MADLNPSLPIPVALVRCPDYAGPELDALVARCLTSAGVAFARGSLVLVKPNLLRATPDGLACTHPRVVRAACLWLQEQGVRVLVADSPGFGSADAVARAVGLEDALRDLGLQVQDLGRPVRRKLPMGHGVAVSRTALEVDGILNLPRLKAHCQLRLTAAVKNLFGCVPGVRKAIAHTRHGDLHGPHGPRLESLIIELGQLLPPTGALLDGIVAMHGRGPAGGQPFPLGLLAAAPGCAALDTAVYTLLRQDPAQVPLWLECRRRGLPGADLTDLSFPLARPEDFDPAGLEIPRDLDPMTFHPLRLARSALKRLWARLV